MKQYLFIGGSYGIGAAMVDLLKEDHKLIVASRTAPAAHPNISHQTFDVLQDAPEKLLLPEALDGLVYCPGSIQLKPFHRLKDEEFMQALEVNTMGLVRVLRKVHPNLKAAEQASVVLFSTVAVGKGMPFHSGVAMAKGALEGLGRSLAAEWAPQVRVNMIAPSLTDTPLAAKWLSSQEKRDRMAERHPLKKIGTASDIAALGVYLLTSASSWMSGQTLAVDGGMSTIKLD